MRKGIRRIHYSQKSIRVDYAVGALASGTDGVGRFGLDAQDSRFIDGEMTESGDRSGSALRAEHGMVSTATPSDSRRATTRRAGFRTLPAKSERPNGVDPLGLSSLVGAIRNGGITENPPTWAPIEFPNFGHRYWENYRLTGEFYVAR